MEISADARRSTVKRSLITGGHGFVGSHLASALLQRGDSVTVLDRGAPPLSGLALQGVQAEVEAIRADLRDSEVVGAVIAAGEFDAVFHLAAQTLVGTAMADPAATFESQRTRHLDAARSLPQQRRPGGRRRLLGQGVRADG